MFLSSVLIETIVIVVLPLWCCLSLISHEVFPCLFVFLCTKIKVILDSDMTALMIPLACTQYGKDYIACARIKIYW